MASMDKFVAHKCAVALVANKLVNDYLSLIDMGISVEIESQIENFISKNIVGYNEEFVDEVQIEFLRILQEKHNARKFLKNY